MSYAPLGDGRTSPHVGSIEMTTKNAEQGSYSYASPQGPPYNANVRYNDPKAYLPPGKATIDNWPVKSQQVAALTPLRGAILAFDIVLASSPLLFVGTRPSTDTYCTY
jgi:hypothetical protein